MRHFIIPCSSVVERKTVNFDVPGPNPGGGVWKRMESVLRYEDGLSIITSEFDSQVFDGN